MDKMKTLINEIPKAKYGRKRKIPNVVFNILGNRIKVSDGCSDATVHGQHPLKAVCSRLGIECPLVNKSF